MKVEKLFENKILFDAALFDFNSQALAREKESEHLSLQTVTKNGRVGSEEKVVLRDSILCLVNLSLLEINHPSILWLAQNFKNDDWFEDQPDKPGKMFNELLEIFLKGSERYFDLVLATIA